MNDKFFDLKKEKQNRMINAALKIFALNGYHKASTDDIVKEAGISKGLLFHYFGSKAGLYLFIYEFSARYMAMELQRAVALREKDLFCLLSQIEDAKNVLLRNYPYMQKFLQTNKEIQDVEILEGIAEYTELIPNALNEVLSRADYSRLVDDVDAEFLVRSMNYIVRGLMETALTEDMNPDLAHKEAKEYFAMMREKFTKPEYLQDI